MEKCVKRMLNEFKQLDKKLMKLIDFISSDNYRILPIEEQRDLCDQQHAMVLYKSALGKRLVRRGYDNIFDRGDTE